MNETFLTVAACALQILNFNFFVFTYRVAAFTLIVNDDFALHKK